MKGLKPSLRERSGRRQPPAERSPCKVYTYINTEAAAAAAERTAYRIEESVCLRTSGSEKKLLLTAVEFKMAMALQQYNKIRWRHNTTKGAINGRRLMRGKQARTFLLPLQVLRVGLGFPPCSPCSHLPTPGCPALPGQMGLGHRSREHQGSGHAELGAW